MWLSWKEIAHVWKEMLLYDRTFKFSGNFRIICINLLIYIYIYIYIYNQYAT